MSVSASAYLTTLAVEVLHDGGRQSPDRLSAMSENRWAQHENVESDLERKGIWDLSVRCSSAGRSIGCRARVIIVRDECSRLFLDAALQQSPPLHRPPLIVEQLGCRGQEKSVLEDSHPFKHPVQWLRLTPPKMAPFFTGSNKQHWPPGPVGRAHRHPGFILAHVLEGAIRTKISDQPKSVCGFPGMMLLSDSSLHSLLFCVGIERLGVIVMPVWPVPR